jgi:hypothetical protein
MVEISGRVIGIDGKPTTDADVFLTEAPATDFSVTHSATPDAKGDFTVRGVPPGSYQLMACSDRLWTELGTKHTRRSR